MNEFEDFEFTIPHEITEETYGQSFGIRFTSGKYDGIIISYGKSGFVEDVMDDNVTLSFEYDIQDYADKTIDDKEEFDKLVGDLLVELIMMGLKTNSNIYTGGVDENRDDNFIESDYE